ncbi:MAG: hypothetical protein VYA89_03010 [Actinomycetota bacterium]|nr:hypothetical protein [Actinomycetota bacterium]
MAPESTATSGTTVAPTTMAAPTTTVVPATTAATTTTTSEPVDEEAVLTASYAWGRSDDALVLQRVLGVEADGWYGPATREAHLAENAARGLSVEVVPAPPTTTTTTPTTVATTTAPPAATTAPPTTAGVPTTTAPPPSTTAGMFGGMGAKLVAQLLGQPCIADGDLSDCGPEVHALVKGLMG